MSEPSFTFRDFNAAALPLERVQGALFIAADEGDAATVKAVLKIYPEAVDWRRPVFDGDRPYIRQETPLMAAAGRGRIEVMRALLEAHAAPSARNSRGGTALHLAAWEGNKEAVELLLAYGASTSIQTELSYTPAAQAEIRGHSDLAKIIRNATHSHGIPFLKNGLPTDTPAPEKASWTKKKPPEFK